MLSVPILKPSIRLSIWYKFTFFLIPFLDLFRKTSLRIGWSTFEKLHACLTRPGYDLQDDRKNLRLVKIMPLFTKIKRAPKNLFIQVQSGLESSLLGRLEFLHCINVSASHS